MRSLTRCLFWAAACAAPVQAQVVPLDSVERTLQAGASWHATRLLAPRLTSADGRTPETLILAARAAGGWQGWNTVERLLNGPALARLAVRCHGSSLLAEAALANSRPPRR